MFIDKGLTDLARDNELSQWLRRYCQEHMFCQYGELELIGVFTRRSRTIEEHRVKPFSVWFRVNGNLACKNFSVEAMFDFGQFQMELFQETGYLVLAPKLEALPVEQQRATWRKVILAAMEPVKESSSPAPFPFGGQ